MLGSTEIIILVVLALILFGASAIPKLARSLGQAKHEFEKGQQEEKDSAEKKESSGEAGQGEEKSDEDESGAGKK